MKILKALMLISSLALSMVVAPSALAAGKIENATAADVKKAVDGAIASSQQALASLQAGESKEIVFEHITTARQESKSIEVGRLDLKRNQASGKLKAARSAIESGDKAKGEELLKEAVAVYKDIEGLL